ncbi:MAG: soluble cytochrome b562 [Pseudohongiellaceae bacterium]|jgi:soluble cytochrome b562
MHLHRTLTRVLCLSAVAAFLAAATVPSSSDESALEELMGDMKANLKTLSTALTTEGGEDTALTALNDMQVITITAKRGVPPHMSEVPKKDQAAHIADYKTQYARLLQELAAIEIDVLAGHADKAMARVRSGLLPVRNDAHDKFQ